MTVKIANNIGFNLYGKYRVVIGRNNGPSLTVQGEPVDKKLAQGDVPPLLLKLVLFN